MGAFARTLRWACATLAISIFSATCSFAETLTGVLYFNDLGNGRYAAGTIELMVAEKLYTIGYGGAITEHFRDDTCHDIGAIWSVSVAHVDHSLEAKRFACNGRFDEDLHQPYLLTVRFLDALGNAKLQTGALSSRYQQTEEYRDFSRLVNSHYLMLPTWLAPASRCIKAVHVEPEVRTQLATFCEVDLGNRPTVLLFDVRKDKNTSRWEIDGIEMQ
jgi:hypothetical protein